MESIFHRQTQMPKPIIHNINKTTMKGLVSLRVEKLSGKVVLEKDNDMVMTNFVRIMYHIMANYETNALPVITLSDSGGNARTGFLGTNTSQAAYVRNAMAYTTPYWALGGASADATTGILLGRGVTAPARTDFAMQDVITHGGGATQMTYNQQTYALLTDHSFSLTREFTNAGGTILVTEAGLQHGIMINLAVYRFLLLHDTFAADTVTVGNGERIIYTFSF